MFKSLKGLFGGEKPKKLVLSPVKGKAVPMSEVSDPTFSQEILGKGIAVIPADGHFVAPADGTVTVVFETKHAICITTDYGAELIIHVGLDTVKLNGEHYTTRVKNGDVVKAGDPILDVDLDAVKAAGYDIITPIVVTNSPQFPDFKALTGDVNQLDPVMEL